jgi:hypothetical protein
MSFPGIECRLIKALKSAIKVEVLQKKHNLKYIIAIFLRKNTMTMKQRIYQIGLFLAALGLLFGACDKKEEETIDPLVGIYTFTSAIFNDTVRMKTPIGNVVFPPSFDASYFVTDGLLGAAPCDDSTNAAVELKSDGKIFYACLFETNEAQMGTWLINTDRTILTLNISNPQAFQLTISDLIISTSSFSGTVENFPLPLDASIELGENLPGGSIPNIQFKSVDLTFTKVP